MGFIAQEVEEVFPEWVSRGKDGLKQITATGINLVLVEALKEQQAEIEALRKELRAIKTR